MESNSQEVMDVVNFGWSKECVKVALLGSIVGNHQAFKAKINERNKIAAFMVEISRHRSDNNNQINREILTHMRAIWCEALWPLEWSKRPVKNATSGTYMSSTAFLEQPHIKDSGVLGRDPCDYIKRTIGYYSKIYTALVADSQFEIMFPLLQAKASSGNHEDCSSYVLGIISSTNLKKASQKKLRGVAGGLCITSAASLVPADVSLVLADVNSDVDVAGEVIGASKPDDESAVDVDSDFDGEDASKLDESDVDVESEEDRNNYPKHEFTDYIETHHSGNVEAFITALTASTRQLKIGSDYPSKVLKKLNAASFQSYFVSDFKQEIVLLKQRPLENLYRMSPIFILEGVIVNQNEFARRSPIETLKTAILLPTSDDRALHVTHPLLISMYRKLDSSKTSHVLVIKNVTNNCLRDSLVLEPSRISINYFGMSPGITWTCATINLVVLSKKLAAQANRTAIENASRIHLESMQRVPTKLKGNKGNAAANKAAEGTHPPAGNKGNAAANKAAEGTQPPAGNKGNAAANKAAEGTQPPEGNKRNAAANKAAEQNKTNLEATIQNSTEECVGTGNGNDIDGDGDTDGDVRSDRDTDGDILSDRGTDGDIDTDAQSVSDTNGKTTQSNAALYNALKLSVSKRPPPVAGQGDSDKGLLGSIQGSGIARLVGAINNDAPRFRTPGVIMDVGSGDGCLSLFLSTCFDGLLSLGIERQTTAHRAALLAQVSQYKSDEMTNRNMAARTLFVHADILDVFVPWYKYTAIIWWYALGWTADKSEPFIQCLISAIHSKECDVQYIATDQLLGSYGELEVLFGPHSCAMQGSGGHGSVTFRVYKVKRSSSYVPSELSTMDVKFLHERFPVISAQANSVNVTVAVTNLLDTVQELEPCLRRPATLTDTILKLRLENDALKKQISAFSNNGTLDPRNRQKMYENYNSLKRYFEPTLTPDVSDVKEGDLSILESRHRTIDDLNFSDDEVHEALENAEDCLRWNDKDSLKLEGHSRVALYMLWLFRIRSDLLKEAGIDAKTEQECKKFFFPELSCYSDYVSKNNYDFNGRDIFSFESVILLIQNKSDSRKWLFVEIHMSQQTICVYDYCSAIRTPYHDDITRNIRKLLSDVWTTTKSSKSRISCWKERYIPPRELVDDEHAYICMFATLNVIDLRLSGLIVDNCNSLPSCLQDDFSVSIRKLYALAINERMFSLPGDTKEFTNLLGLTSDAAVIAQDNIDGEEDEDGEVGGVDEDQDSMGDSAGEKRTFIEPPERLFVAPLLATALEKLIPGGEPCQMGRPIMNKCLKSTNPQHTTNICWLISILQGLFHSSQFIDMLVNELGPFNIETPEKANTFLESVWYSAIRSHQKNVENKAFDLVSLHSLLYRELREKSKITGSKLLKFVTTKPGVAGELITRHDYNQISSGLDCIMQLMGKPALELFGLVLRSSSYCERCKQTVDISGEKESRHAYELGSLEDIFEDSFYAGIFSDCNKLYECDNCHYRAARRSNYYEPSSARQMLAISFGGADNDNKRSRSKQTYPQQLRQSHTIILPTCPQYKNFEIYKISSIVNGIGGHYVIDVYNDDLTQVCHFNDEAVCLKDYVENVSQVETPALMFARKVADSDFSTESRTALDSLISRSLHSYDQKEEYAKCPNKTDITVSSSESADRVPTADLLAAIPIVVTEVIANNIGEVADQAIRIPTVVTNTANEAVAIVATTANESLLTKRHRIEPTSAAGQFTTAPSNELQQSRVKTSNAVVGRTISAAALSNPVVANGRSASGMADVPMRGSVTQFFKKHQNTGLGAAVSIIGGKSAANPIVAVEKNSLHTTKGTQVLAAHHRNVGQDRAQGAEGKRHLPVEKHPHTSNGTQILNTRVQGSDNLEMHAHTPPKRRRLGMGEY